MPAKRSTKTGATRSRIKQHTELPVDTETPPVPVPAPKPQLPTPVTPASKSWAPQKHEAPLGPWAQIIQSAIERIQQIAQAIGRYETFVMVLVIVGIYSVCHADAGSAWAIFAIIAAGMAAPLTALWVRKRLSQPRVKTPRESKSDLPPKSTPGQIDVTPNAILDA